MEQFGVVMLDTKHRLIRIRIIAIGSLDTTVVHPREVFREAAAAAAAAIVLFHNHPSGDPTPSADDLVLTHRMLSAGMVMGIDVVDHIILADQRYCSLLEVGRDRPARLTACRERLLIRLKILTALYFDCFSGASGDMILGALIDAGVKLEDVRQALGSLAITPERSGPSRWFAAVFARRSSTSAGRARSARHAARHDDGTHDAISAHSHAHARARAAR